MHDVVIVGAGAAGLATAIFVKELNPRRSVALLDGAKKPGAKILVSGGGRCNVTNRVVSARDYWGGAPAPLRSVLRALTVDDTIAFFARIGVQLHEEPHGKLFPDSNRARDVLDALLRAADRAEVELKSNHRVVDVVAAPGGFQVATLAGAFGARRVVLATGGRSLPKSGSDGAGYGLATRLGHTIVPTTPALAPLMLRDGEAAIHPRLSGVSHPAEITIWIDGRAAERLTGDLLWTHFGVSGPVALDASRHWARAVLEDRNVALTLNVLPARAFDAVEAALMLLIQERPRASIATLLSQLVPASLADALLGAAGIDGSEPAGRLEREDRRRLVHRLVSLPLDVTDTRGYGFAEATAGGIPLGEISAATLESRVCPGLYLVGEMLDVDGRIGGFNFQWAWSSAYVAARAIARAG